MNGWRAIPGTRSHRVLNVLDSVPGLAAQPLARKAYLRLTGMPRFSWDMARADPEAVGGPNAWLDIYGLFSTAKLRFFSQQMWEQLGDHLPYDDLKLNLDRARRWHPFNRSLYVGARVMLPGLLLASKGDRVAMNSSVETRYPFLDEEVFSYLAALASALEDARPARQVHSAAAGRSLGARSDRLAAQGDVPRSDGRLPHRALPTFVDQLLSPESSGEDRLFRRPGRESLAARVQEDARAIQSADLIEMGLAGVVATQLWHHTFIDGSLADLPSLVTRPGVMDLMLEIGKRQPAVL